MCVYVPSWKRRHKWFGKLVCEFYFISLPCPYLKCKISSCVLMFYHLTAIYIAPFHFDGSNSLQNLSFFSKCISNASFKCRKSWESINNREGRLERRSLDFSVRDSVALPFSGQPVQLQNGRQRKRKCSEKWRSKFIFMLGKPCWRQ